MTNKDLIYVIEQIGREKGIDKEILFEALESALLSASKKTMGVADNVRMQIDRQTGSLRVFARKKVVEEVTDREARDRPRRGPQAQRRGRAGRRARAGAGPPGVRAHRRPDGQAGHPAAGARRRARRHLLRVHRQGRPDRARRRPPHREAQRDRRDRQGRGVLLPSASRSPASATTRATASAPTCSRSRRRPRARRSCSRGRIPATSRGCSRPRSPRSRRASCRCARPPARRASAPRSPWRRPSATSIRSAPAWACAARASRSSAASCAARRSTSSSGRTIPRRSWRARCRRPRCRR